MIDFTDLGGAAVKEPSKTKIDFADLGGQSVSAPTTTQPGILDSIQGIINDYKKTQQFTPQGMLENIDTLIRQGTGKLADKVSEGFAGPGLRIGPLFSPGPKVKLSPEVAAGIGTAISSAYDIATSFVNPIEGAEVGAAKLAKNKYAQEKLLTAMGTPKRLLKTPELIKKAEEHAQVLLEQGVAKPLRGTKGIAEHLTELESSSGQKIGSILDTLGEKGKVFNPQSAIEEINKLRPTSKSTGQILRGGAYDKINGKIDEAIATVQAHSLKLPDGSAMNQPLSFQEANDLKGVLQSQANYASNKDATLLDKIIAGKFRGSVDHSLEKAAKEIGDPALAKEFQQSKKIYAATQFAQDPVYNKLAGELTGKKISLTDWILGSASLASGNPLTAVVEIGLKKGIEKFGPMTQAAISNALTKTPEILTKGLQVNALSELMRKISPDSQSSLVNLLRNLPQSKETALPPNSPTPPPALEMISAAKSEKQKSSKGKILDEETALSYLDAAGNDPQKARKMAIADGWTIP